MSWKNLKCNDIPQAFRKRNSNGDLTQSRVNYLQLDKSTLEPLPDLKVSHFFLSMAVREPSQPNEADFNPKLRIYFEGNSYEEVTFRVLFLKDLIKDFNCSDLQITCQEAKGLAMGWRDSTNAEIGKAFFLNGDCESDQLVGYRMSSRVNPKSFGLLTNEGRIRKEEVAILLGIKAPEPDNYTFAPILTSQIWPGADQIDPTDPSQNFIEYLQPCPPACEDPIS